MHLLILRFSSIGDVALTIPVLLKVREQYPDVEITMVSRKMYRPLFEGLGFGFIEADLNGNHKGIKGLARLYRQIWKETKPDAVIDLHSVLRTHILQALFRLRKIPFFKIDKGRNEKARLTRREDKVLQQLPHTTQRYARVFSEAGFDPKFDPGTPPLPAYESKEASAFTENLSNQKLVGIAPLAAFPGKSWPLDKMNALIDDLVKQNLTVILFGGPNDKPYLQKLAADRDEVIILTGRFDFAGEIVVMRSLQLMISMDSSNMHLATLAGIPVVSVWGATHPFAGFGPLGNNEHLEAAVPVEKLNCRPCSVFGNKPCFRKDYACLNWLEESTVLDRVNAALNRQRG